MARRTIWQTELSNFEVDDDGRLFWKEQQVVTEMMLKLPKTLEWIAGFAGMAVIFGFLLNLCQVLGFFPTPS